MGGNSPISAARSTGLRYWALFGFCAGIRARQRGSWCGTGRCTTVSMEGCEMMQHAGVIYWRRRDADARLEGTVVSTGAKLLC